MKPTTRRSVNKLALLLGIVALGATGCTIAAVPPSVSVAPAEVVHTTHVVHHAPPTRVYHHGRWLHYRTDGYYYRTSGSWAVAPAVPSHVHAHHRPGRPTHVTTSRGHGPTHVRRSSGPTHVRRSSQPTHVRRTVSNRRTYRR